MIAPSGMATVFWAQKAKARFQCAEFPLIAVNNLLSQKRRALASKGFRPETSHLARVPFAPSDFSKFEFYAVPMSLTGLELAVGSRLLAHHA
jgi:hypothetical protein